MVAKTKLRDFYPVSLFFALLFMGVHVVVSNQNYAVDSTEWGKILDHDKGIGACKDSLWPFVIDPACKDLRENEVISPIFLRDNFHRRLSQIDKLTNN